MGYGPERFAFHASQVSLPVPEDMNTVQRIVNYAKTYVAAANVGYEQQLKEKAEAEDRRQRKALEEKIAKAEVRSKMLTSIKL